MNVCNCIDVYYISVSIPPLPGAALNFGTWQSAIYGFAHAQVFHTWQY